MFRHPRLNEIESYTAMRLGCSLNALKHQGSTIVAVTEPEYQNLLVTSCLSQSDIICLTQTETCSIIRHNGRPTKAVANLLRQINCTDSFSSEDFLKFENVKQKGSIEPYFYLTPQDFRPFAHPQIFQLSPDNIEHITLVKELHQTIEQNQRWFVEIDHPVVYGYQIREKLVGIASNFLFESPQFKVAAAGALVHPGYRQQNVGKAVVSAICQWALERNYLVEWSSWSENIASIALAKSLGFKQFLTEQEFAVS